MASWLEKIKQDLVIVTGDGQRYTPLYLNASANKSKEFNVSKFEFIDLKGSLIDRRLPMGVQYDIEIIFQGATNVDDGEKFFKSADNPAAWQINHPQYGGIVVQPLGLKSDNSGLNTTVITGTIIETIGTAQLAPALSPPDVVTSKAAISNAQLAKTYAANQPTPSTTSISALRTNLASSFNSINTTIADAEDYNQYFNAFNQCNGLLNATVFATETAIGTLQAMIMLPVGFNDTIVNRMAMFGKQLDALSDDIIDLVLTGEKQGYENNAGALIAGICSASVTNITSTDYLTRNDVVAAIALIIQKYNGYLDNLCGMQTHDGGSPDSYIPNPDGLSLLDSLLYYTVGSLYGIAASAKQQRTYILPYDSNVILVANKLYGILPDDSTIKTIISNNNIVGYELFKLQQGRQIIYYV